MSTTEIVFIVCDVVQVISFWIMFFLHRRALKRVDEAEERNIEYLKEIEWLKSGGLKENDKYNQQP